eukprot:EG_transcript_43363
MLAGSVPIQPCGQLRRTGGQRLKLQSRRDQRRGHELPGKRAGSHQVLGTDAAGSGTSVCPPAGKVSRLETMGEGDTAENHWESFRFAGGKTAGKEDMGPGPPLLLYCLDAP